ncbi:outer membrane protein transport protein [Flavobacterium sp. NRK F10]|uniref:Transporter n=1 Tax=Flavobacterium sediminis TaxID=2201181 RepID=A0A2U8QW75_9FLAO|nr:MULTISPECIES: outer membrane protein transport protein [Flavobacterium]AWM14452.1 transporter [Flavobacterium sediminis]MCO6175682.1 outer membrane protein transport protein [Flavobacterium sp. NRK F10]
MKKILLSSIFLLGLFSHAQEIRQEDGLRYAIQDLTGTARFRAMSGAFGAVGGDLSALNVNPAGSAVFNNNYASFSASNYNTSNKSNYFGLSTKENNSTLDINQAGAVLVFKNTDNASDWKKFSIGLNYENTHDFDNEIFIAGTNPNNSISNYFLNYAQGIPESTLSNSNYYDLNFGGQQAFLGYQTYLFDPTSAGANTYTSNVPPGSYYQENYITTSGFNGKVTGNFATSYKDRLFIGLNLNAHFTDYVRTTNLYESNNNNPNLGVQAIYFDNEVYTYGTGFSFNLGAIVKVTDALRVGAAYESPTWYRLRDELTQSIDAFSNDGSTTYHDYYYPNITNIYPVYKVQTPSKWTGSAAYIFGQKGLISADVSYKDYSSIEFKPKNEDVYQNLNMANSNLLTDAIEVRVGGEYKFKQWSFRAGYRFEESPYKVDYAMGDLTGYTGGLGYSFGESRIDLAYSNAHRNYNQYLISSGMNDTARIRTTQNNVTLTYSINF